MNDDPGDKGKSLHISRSIEVRGLHNLHAPLLIPGREQVQPIQITYIY
jgi:hypothetical protein